jgi:vitamin B12 transporter
VASLFQRFSQFGDPSLQPERSVGYDAGIDQKLFGDRVTASVTAFENHYRNLIDFATVPSCTPAQVAAGGGCYFNVGRAETKGIETAADIVIVPDEWRTRVSYTYMVATNLVTHTELLERPRDKATVSLIYTGVPKLEVEGRLTLVSSRLAFGTVSDVELEPYAKVDVYANYKATDQVTLFGRIENLTDTHYEEAYNFGTAGRSFYGGVKVAW